MERKPTDIVQLKLRIREDLRQELEADARGRKISMNTSIIERLEWSFLIDEVSQGRADIMILVSLITAITIRIENTTGKKWFDDQTTFQRIRMLIERAIEQAPSLARENASLTRAVHNALMDLLVAGAMAPPDVEGETNS